MEYISPLGLQIFKDVMELKSFRAAAQYLQISQPAVSAHIHRLEETLNVQLFEQPYRRILRPTEDGMLLYRYAVDFSAMTQEMVSHLRELTAGNRGEVKFALSVCKPLFSKIAACYLRANPKVSLVFRAGNSMEVKRLVQHGVVNFGIEQKSEDDPCFDYELLYKTPMTLFCAKTHPLADKKTVTVDDLLGFPFVNCLNGSRYNQRINVFLSQLGIDASNRIQVEDGSILLNIVEDGFGLGILSLSTIENAIAQGRVVSLSLESETELPPTECRLIFRKNTRLSPATVKFIEYVREEIARHGYLI
ncbi:MAG: LysR family transcriptional regulator [Clostridiales Family XIII bacterium]|nr:LysR family transcriptional regulator [Clostridiales Family XIII bacterium]